MSTTWRRPRQLDDELRRCRSLNRLQRELVVALADDLRSPAGVTTRERQSVAAFQQTLARITSEALGAVTCRFEPGRPTDDVPVPTAGRRRVPGRVRVEVPVASRGTLHGVLRLELDGDRRIDADERSFLQEVAWLLATAIDHDAARRRLERLALYDALTGLPNRGLLLDRLDHALQRAARDGGRVGVLFIDLDAFKQINDAWGHAVGDRALSAAAERLQDALRPTDTIGRLGGDEFAVVCEAIQNKADAWLVADRLRAALSTPLVVGGGRLLVTASIGVAVGEAHTLPDALFRDADRAMYEAKAQGRDRVRTASSDYHVGVDPSPR